MRVAILGSNGFIGKRFCDLYRDKFDNFSALTRQTASLDNLKKLQENTKDIDILVHTAFDHAYKSNRIGIKNVLEVCLNNGIQRLIYLSTISVYSSDLIGGLSEDSPYSELNDPYSKEKRSIEHLIKHSKNEGLDIIILQPSIVYGLGGNWTKFALHAAKVSTINLPNAGEYICNAVFVDDVAKAIFQACSDTAPAGSYLISGSEATNWKYFYQAHANLLEKEGYPNSLNVVSNTDINQYHKLFLVDKLFYLWYETPFCRIFELMLTTLKRIRAKNYRSLDTQAELKSFLESDNTRETISLSGITRKVHQCQFTVSNEKSQKLLGYSPQYNFKQGMAQIGKGLRELRQ